MEFTRREGGRVYLQIWHARRAAHSSQTGEGSIAPSVIRIRGNLRKNLSHVQPRAMTTKDFETVRKQFKQGGLNAKEAGFDGIGLHAASGYFIDLS